MPYHDLLHLSIQTALCTYVERIFHFMFGWFYLFVLHINHIFSSDSKTRPVFIGNSSCTMFFFFLPFLFLILPLSFFFSVFFLPFCIHSFLLSFLRCFFRFSFLTHFLPYFGWFCLCSAWILSTCVRMARLYFTSLGFIRLGLVFLGYFFCLFWLGCVVRLLFYRSTMITFHVAMYSRRFGGGHGGCFRIF